MKRGSATIGGLARTPGFAGIAEDLQQRFILIFIIREHSVTVCDEQNVSFGWEPFEISQAFF